MSLARDLRVGNKHGGFDDGSNPLPVFQAPNPVPAQRTAVFWSGTDQLHLATHGAGEELRPSSPPSGPRLVSRIETELIVAGSFDTSAIQHYNFLSAGNVQQSLDLSSFAPLQEVYAGQVFTNGFLCTGSRGDFASTRFQSAVDVSVVVPDLSALVATVIAGQTIDMTVANWFNVNLISVPI